MCLEGQYGRAAKVLASEGLAPDIKALFKALEKLHPKEPIPDVSLPDNIASNAFQFSENAVYEQLKTFSKHTAAGPSKMFPEHLQHAVDCTAPDRSEFALKAITKFVNFGSRGLFPVFYFQSTLLRFTHGFILKEWWGASDSSWQSVATPHSKMLGK